MKDRFYAWLESMGQEPHTFPQDLLFYIARFTFLIFLVLSPMSFIHLLMPAGAGIAKTAKLPPFFFWFIPAYAIYLFVAICFVLSTVGGWRRLAAKFPAPKEFKDGQSFWGQSGSIGGVSYNHTLRIRVADSGLYLKCSIPFQKPILIPWQEIKAINDVRVIWQVIPFFIVGSPKIASIALENKKLVAAAREMWEAKR